MGRLAAPLITRAGQAWRLFYGPTKAAALRRAKSERIFERMCPEGHAHSLRPLVSFRTCRPSAPSFQTEFYEGFSIIHPEAFNLIARYGIDYRPQVMDVAYYHSLQVQPTIGQCFGNSVFVMQNEAKHPQENKEPLGYVEGVALGVNVEPMLHAWNARLCSTTAFDWTFYTNCQWTRYIGIPFTLEEYTWLREQYDPGCEVMTLFHREMYLKLKPYMLEVLRRRPNRLQKPAE